MPVICNKTIFMPCQCFSKKDSDFGTVPGRNKLASDVL